MRHYERITPALAACLLLGCVLSAAPAQAQLSLPRTPVNDLPRIEPLERRIDRTIERTRRQADDTVDDATDTAEETTGAVVETVEDTTETAAAIVDDVAEQAAGTLRAFTAGVDPDGFDIEAATIVVLAAPDEVDRILSTATRLISQRELPGLGRVLLVLEAPAGVPLPQSIESLRQLSPGATIDYNHLYRPTATPATAAGEPPADEDRPARSAAIRVGIIDSAVMTAHPALRDVSVTPRDFVTHEAARPLTHGTAVASLVARSSRGEAGIHAASVFFQLPDLAPGATAESLVAALDWMVSSGVDAINMSLAGPGNALLEAAVESVIGHGVPLVAAVGNNGPSAPPMYPAAYDGVIGVTAVDRNKRVFRYANRGDYVDFAARGVNMKVADSNTGGYRIESGTSMASPHVAVIVAEIARQPSVEFDALSSWLLSSAEDLGKKGYDETFGHGLITAAPVIVSAAR